MAARPSHTNSRTWVNPRMAEGERWLQVEENLKKMELIPRSPFVPHTFDQWIAHRQGRLEDVGAEQAKKLARMQEHLKPRHPDLPPPGKKVHIGPAFGGKRFNDGRSAVLAIPTVWCSWYKPTVERPQALWPCVEEMKEEGDERKTSGFRRFPGLPRVPGNETVVWKQKNVVQALLFDEVWRLPTAESVAAAKVKADAEETERMEELLGEGLLDAIDCKTGDSY
ncbi:hypothetical protein MMC28_003917 [Mycoblastus sanguinarius]|nr:hypothetical protein [Mycoblastus sanguinarius]